MKDGKIGVCLIGAGRAGMIHAINFAKAVPGAKIIAVADPFEDAAKQACKTLEIDTWYSSYKQALNDASVDAVVVVSPTKFHRDIVVDAANAKKHVLCEKPMAMNRSECREMATAAKDNKTVLQIGFMRRFDASFMAAEEALLNGEIGDVVMVRSNTRGPSVPQPWMYDLRASNGTLAEVNSHDIDTLRWFSGGEYETIYAIGGNYRCEDARTDYPDYYDNLCLVATFNNGRQGMLDGAASVEYGYDARVEILGTRGCIFVGQVHDKSTAVVTKNGVVKPAMNTWRHLFREAYLAEDIHFIDCIREGREPKVSGHDGMMAVAAVEAGNASIKEKRIVKMSEFI